MRTFTTRFRTDNTEGYTGDELAELNDAFNQILAEEHAADSVNEEACKSHEDYIAEQLLVRYDAGKRGNDLR
jgi:hypothetical protein